MSALLYTPRGHDLAQSYRAFQLYPYTNTWTGTSPFGDGAPLYDPIPHWIGFCNYERGWVGCDDTYSATKAYPYLNGPGLIPIYDGWIQNRSYDARLDAERYRSTAGTLIQLLSKGPLEFNQTVTDDTEWAKETDVVHFHASGVVTDRKLGVALPTYNTYLNLGVEWESSQLNYSQKVTRSGSTYSMTGGVSAVQLSKTSWMAKLKKLSPTPGSGRGYLWYQVNNASYFLASCVIPETFKFSQDKLGRLTQVEYVTLRQVRFKSDWNFSGASSYNLAYMTRLSFSYDHGSCDRNVGFYSEFVTTTREVEALGAGYEENYPSGKAISTRTSHRYSRQTFVATSLATNQPLVPGIAAMGENMGGYPETFHMRNFWRLRPAINFARAEGVDTWLSGVSSNYIETFSEITEALSYFPEAAKALSELLASDKLKVVNGELTVVKRALTPLQRIRAVAVLIAGLYVAYTFAAKPQKEDLEAAPAAVANLTTKLLSLSGPRTLYGKYVTEFTSGPFSGCTLVTRTKSRYNIPDNYLLFSVLNMDRAGMFPSPDRLWNIAPWTWAIDYFTDIGEKLRVATSSSYAIAMQHQWTLVSYKLYRDIPSTELDFFGLQAVHSPKYILYKRELTLQPLAAISSDLEFAKPQVTSNKALLGSLLISKLK